MKQPHPAELHAVDALDALLAHLAFVGGLAAQHALARLRLRLHRRLAPRADAPRLRRLLVVLIVKVAPSALLALCPLLCV